jgi:hypothetical protein
LRAGGQGFEPQLTVPETVGFIKYP